MDGRDCEWLRIVRIASQERAYCSFSLWIQNGPLRHGPDEVFVDRDNRLAASHVRVGRALHEGGAG